MPIPAGEIVELWRYPVASIGGEQVTSAQVGWAGVYGDRRFALIDAQTGFAAAPEMDKRWRKALFLNAACTDTDTPNIIFPDGEALTVSNRSINEALSDYFHFAVAVASLDPNYHLNDFPITSHRHPHSAVHLVTTTSIEHLGFILGGATVSSKRFRPTAVIATTEQYRFLEDEWVGKNAVLGSVSLSAEERTKRCGMTIVSQPGLDEDPEILRNILRHNQRNFGVNCSVTAPGQLAVGDELIIQQ